MPDAKTDLLWVVVLLVILGFVWFYTGGPLRESSRSGPFIKAPLETESFKVQRQTEEITGGSGSPSADGGSGYALETGSQNQSSFSLEVRLRNSYSAWETDPLKEYVEVEALNSNKESVNITGWSLVGKSGLDIKIGLGTILPIIGQISGETGIVLKPGERAYVVTGRSPLGTSFKVNKCTGYLNKARNIFPSLGTSCPEPLDENPPGNLDDKCLDYIETIPRCEAGIGPYPLGLSAECQSFLIEKINYNACVSNHKNDPDFYKSEWRVYLGREEDLWRDKRETIILRDSLGKAVDSVSY